MRILEDLSIFRNRTAKQRKRTAKSVIYHDGQQFRYDSLHGAGNLPLSCRMFCRSTLREDPLFQRRINQDFLSMEYIYSGELCIRSGERAWIAEPGDLSILHPGQDTELLYLPESGECRKFGMIPDGPLLPFLMNRLNLDGICNIHFPDPNPLETLAERFWNALRNDDETAPERISGILFEFLTLMSRSIASPSPSEAVTEIRNELQGHLADKISMRELARKYHMSLPVFNRMFLEAEGKTPYQYLIQQRMSAALGLLSRQDLRIKEVALRTGYADPLHFSAEFKRIYQCSPREFRKKNSGSPPEKTVLKK